MGVTPMARDLGSDHAVVIFVFSEGTKGSGGRVVVRISNPFFSAMLLSSSLSRATRIDACGTIIDSCATRIGSRRGTEGCPFIAQFSPSSVLEPTPPLPSLPSVFVRPSLRGWGGCAVGFSPTPFRVCQISRRRRLSFLSPLHN